MRTFVINLNKNVDRMEFMDRQLKRLNCDYERIPAVYGKEMTLKEKRREFSSIRSFLASGFKLRDGEIGCSLSHCMIYKKMKQRGISAALIFEDDVLITDKLSDAISRVVQFMDCAKKQVFLLSSLGVRVQQELEIQRIKAGMCADGYIITLPAAECIYKANYPVLTVADRWERWVKRFDVELYRVWPTVVCQNNDKFGTDISMVKRRSFRGLSKLVYKISRAIELVIDWVLYKILGR